jgi:hypothetical protein
MGKKGEIKGRTKVLNGKSQAGAEKKTTSVREKKRGKTREKNETENKSTKNGR